MRKRVQFVERYVLVLFFLVASLASSPSQSFQKKFEYLTIDDGLSHNTVNCILKDSRGFMWFGTNEGLSKYDGYRFTVYKHNPKEAFSISDNRVFSLAEDEEGDLWVGTRNGLNRYSRKSDSFTRYYIGLDSEGAIGQSFIRSLHVESLDRVWVGILGGGLYLFSPQTGAFIKQRSKADIFTQSEAGLDVSSVLLDSRGRLWFTNNCHGLNLFDPTHDKVTFYPFENDSYKLVPLGKTIYEDNFGTIWVCTEGNGLFRFQEPENLFTHYAYRSDKNSISNNIVKSISQGKDGRYWIATDGGGLNVYDPSTRRFDVYAYDISTNKGLKSDGIYTLYADDKDIMWIGTFGGGVNLLDSNVKQFGHHTQTGKTTNELSHPSVLSFCEDNQNRIWIGTDGGGVNLFDPSTGMFQHFKHDPEKLSSIGSNAVTVIYQDVNGLIWFGTYAGGLNYLDPVKKQFRRYMEVPGDTNSINSNNVWSIYEDSRGNFWVGTNEGLNLFDKRKGTFKNVDLPGTERLYSKKVTNILEDSQGDIWLGGAFLSVLNPQSGVISRVQHEDINGFDIRAIVEDSKGRIWIGTEGGGMVLYHKDPGTFEVFNMNNGLPSDAVHNILEDGQGMFWISTNQGLSRFNPETRVFRNYDQRDGLQSNQFSYNGALLSRTGNMYFGGVNGFNMFNPELIHDNEFIPPVVFTDFKLMNREVPIGQKGSPLEFHISETRAIVLKHEQSVVTIEFAALNYTSSDKNQYAYKLEGFDSDWNYVGHQRLATYTNLNAGDYVFRVKASNNDGVWNEHGASLDVKILPPWWKTPWAYIGYAFLMIGILFSFRNYSLKQQALRNALVMKDVEKQKGEELNQAKIKFYTNISHEFRTPLTLILGPLEKIMSTFNADNPLQVQFKMIHSNTLRLYRLINQIMDFRKIETNNMHLNLVAGDLVSFVRDIKELFNHLAFEHKIDYELKTDLERLIVWFDRDKMDVVIYNLLSNAFKFTPDGGQISITLEVGTPEPGTGQEGQECTIIKVRDSGIGIDGDNINRVFDRFYQVNDASNPRRGLEQHGTGIGLALTKEFVLMHKGQVQVESEPGKGSVFTVSIPINKSGVIFGQELSLMETSTPLENTKSDEVLPQKFAEPSLHDEAVRQVEPIVLVVEDHADMRVFIKDSLADEYSVLLAEDGRVGLEIAFKEIPDLIISDVLMPEMNGFEMAELLRRDYRTSHIPLIFLSAANSVESSLHGLEVGADDYIQKPFNAAVLAAKVKNIIASRKRLQDKLRKDFLSSPSEVVLESPEEFFLDKAIKIVEAHIANPEFDVREFYTEMGMSRSVLYRKLEAITGSSVNEFVRSIRLKRAADLLKQNKLSISEVSYEVGFNDPQYFSKCFRKEFGKSPSKYASDFIE
jgi:signal transduction histidine kinase/ligand-binding sensor domain-containing protein/DNA-binding response OmpR family regulator